MTTDDLVIKLAEALRLTQEYVGDEVLPALPGWSWYDALEEFNEWKSGAFDYENEQRLRRLCGKHGYAYQIFPFEGYDRHGRYAIWVYQMKDRGPDVTAGDFRTACERLESKLATQKKGTPR